MIFSLNGAFLAEPDPLLFLIEELISGDDGDGPGVELRSPKNSVTLIASKFRSGNRKHLKTANENSFVTSVARISSQSKYCQIILGKITK